MSIRSATPPSKAAPAAASGVVEAGETRNADTKPYKNGSTATNQNSNGVHHSHSPSQFHRVPDNFGSLASCAHLDQVLESRAKDTVLGTYRQAVLVSQPISDTTTYRTKDGATVDWEKLASKKRSSLRCSECHLPNFYHLMICLQCPNVSCHEHSIRHYKSSSHMFAIDSAVGLLYCFKCENYVNHSLLELLRCQVQGTRPHISQMENYDNPNKLSMLGLKGFINLGSTCFMSSILQTFIHNPIVRCQFINNDLHYFNCKYLYNQEVTGTLNEDNACITCSIDGIFKDFFTAQDIKGYGMTNLLSTAWYKQKSLAGFQEQDAHEFWLFLLNEFHSDHIRVIKEEAEGGEEEEEHPCTCVGHACFSFELQSCVRCQCGAENITVDPPTFELSLELSSSLIKKDQEGTINLVTCLDSFTREEELESKISCKNCLKQSGASKTLKLKSTPPVLSIQLKRFNHNISNDTSSKVEIPVQVPPFLDLAKYTVNDADEMKIYELFSVVCHIGSVSTGHYVVYAKGGQGQWFKFDDSVITIEKENTVMEAAKTNGYLLYYILHDT
ncbi:uncharacterized protein LODBEIA_P38060 [Lodderomyces beijingensis]|uniref:Ubiquitin carboxyl-terminal hydrolase n=1 Tax=Lodderomyces beijingensis TaxID=1775926 RepID=A0ABP0ZN81_9ASCO